MKPSAIARIAKTLINLRVPFMLHGPVGAGKSAVMRQVTDALDMQLVDIRLSQMDPTDIKGFPAPDLVSKTMNWLPASFLPPMQIKGKPNKTKGLLFFDELNSAPPMVQASCYQLFLDGKVGDYTLPEGWRVAAAGNRDIDRSLVNRMPAALANRMVHLDFDVDLDDFVQWAMNEGNLSATSIAFVRFREELLHKFQPDSKDKAFPTPRTWAYADKLMASGLNGDDLLEALSGTVGRGAAGERIAFETMASQIPSVDQIALDPANTPVPEAPGASYAVTSMLSMASKDVGAFRSFLPYVNRMPVEFQVVYMKDMMGKSDKVPIKTTKEFTQWAMTNKDVVL